MLRCYLMFVIIFFLDKSAGKGKNHFMEVPNPETDIKRTASSNGKNGKFIPKHFPQRVFPTGPGKAGFKSDGTVFSKEQGEVIGTKEHPHLSRKRLSKKPDFDTGKRGLESKATDTIMKANGQAKKGGVVNPKKQPASKSLGSEKQKLQSKANSKKSVMQEQEEEISQLKHLDFSKNTLGSKQSNSEPGMTKKHHWGKGTFKGKGNGMRRKMEEEPGEDNSEELSANIPEVMEHNLVNKTGARRPGAKRRPMPRGKFRREGCGFQDWAPLFTKTYDTSNQAGGWHWNVIWPIVPVENKVGWPNYPWMPDGHISTLRHPDGSWYIFYPNSASYRTKGPSPVIQESWGLDPGRGITHGEKKWDEYDNGGQWLMAAFPTGKNGHLTGFIHSEDHYWSGSALSHEFIHKSIAIACSKDYGASWKVKGQIITVNGKPHPPRIPCCSGSADQDVVWDWQNRRWHLETMRSAAINYDKGAGVSGWRKWNGHDFVNGPLGDEMALIKDTNGGDPADGANPSIHWNTYLQLWVKVWHSWHGDIFIASSRNLPFFDPGRVLIAKSTWAEKNWYPTLISRDGGDREGDKYLHLYYRQFPQGTGSPSVFMSTAIELIRS